MKSPVKKQGYWQCPVCRWQSAFIFSIDIYPPILCYNCKACGYHYEEQAQSLGHCGEVCCPSHGEKPVLTKGEE